MIQEDIISENRHPNIVFMKVELAESEIPSDSVKVLLGINFGGVELKSFKIGSVWYELRRGSLRIKLENAISAYSSRWLNGRIDVKYASKRVVESERDEKHVKENYASGDLKLGVSPKGANSNASVKDGSKKTTSYGELKKVKETFDHTYWLVTTKGSEKEPVWDFWPKEGNTGLIGYIKDCLCTLGVSAKPCYLDATFEVSNRDISITEVSGLWPDSCVQNKRKIIKMIAIRSIISDLNPFMSRHKLKYE